MLRQGSGGEAPEGAGRRRARRTTQAIWSPPGHWLLFGLAVFVLLTVVLLQGFATHTVGLTSEPGGSGSAPLASDPPILVARGSSLVPAEIPPGRAIALTFDDGPSAAWTPPIARVLRDDHVPATFFEIGSQVARYPDITRTLIHQGDEIGNHTFTHVLVSAIPAWESRLQLGLTDAAITGATGEHTRLFRPPYSATPNAVSRHDERALAKLVGRRYFVVLANYDSQDWQRPGVRQIVANATPPAGHGGIIMMHDGGGNRAETLAALKLLIPRLRARGFYFVTVSQLIGVPRAAVMPPARGWVGTRGQVFLTSVRLAYALTTVSAGLLVVIVALVLLRTIMLFAFATRHAVRVRRLNGRREHATATALPSAVVIVPAHNEAVDIEKTVRSLAASDYPGLQVVVVDDGSTDDTAAIVEGLDLERVRLVRQDNLGKAAALQAGVEVTDSEIVAMVDADTQFEPQTLRILVGPFTDPEVAAVSGNTKVGNRHRLLALWQHVEYVIGFNLDRRMYDVLRCMPTIPGAVGAFRRSVLEEVGGVPGDTLAEDTDLTLAIGRAGHRVAYVEQARAWTEAPSTLRSLWRQRYRWAYGTIQAVVKHRGAVLARDRRERRIGWITLPYLTLFHIVLPLLAPMIDLFAIYDLLFIGAAQAAIVWGAFNGLQVLTAAYGLWLDRESLRTVWVVPLQQFVYRQLMYLVIFESMISALKGVRSGWRHLQRTGDAVVGAAQP
jgi:cellulose synthase/poly-beta-1,6-N-acetylglucosamine synthase-like glycosyltransferase/peptidoglycan/xylan/chitin deacetylase (PgdA/CDA1 family)